MPATTQELVFTDAELAEVISETEASASKVHACSIYACKAGDSFAYAFMMLFCHIGTMTDRLVVLLQKPKLVPYDDLD